MCIGRASVQTHVPNKIEGITTTTIVIIIITHMREIFCCYKNLIWIILPFVHPKIYANSYGFPFLSIYYCYGIRDITAHSVNFNGNNGKRRIFCCQFCTNQRRQRERKIGKMKIVKSRIQNNFCPLSNVEFIFLKMLLFHLGWLFPFCIFVFQ